MTSKKENNHIVENQTKICLARVQSPIAASSMFTMQFTGSPDSCFVWQRGRPHMYIQHARLHSASSAFTLTALFIFTPFKVALNLKISFHNTGKWLWNLSQHLASHWIPWGSSGHCWECSAQCPHLFSVFVTPQSSTLSFLFLLSPELTCFCTSSWSLFPGPLSLLSGEEEGERRCVLSLGKGH